MRFAVTTTAFLALILTSDVHASSTFDVTNVFSSAYRINGVNNPTLTLERGKTYTFLVNAPGHPFWIKTVRSTGTGNAYNSGVTGNGTQVGTVTFAVPSDAPATLFYDCELHFPMGGRIDVVTPEPVPGPSTLARAALALLIAAAGVAAARRRGRMARQRATPRFVTKEPGS